MEDLSSMMAEPVSQPDPPKILNKYFCLLPWMHACIFPMGKLTPCCVYDFTKIDEEQTNKSLYELFNSDHMKTLRKNMLKGVPSEGCSACYKVESSKNTVSLRQSSIDKFLKHIDITKTTSDDGSVNYKNIKYVDIRFSNICNLKCRSCGPLLSSSWYNDYKILNPEADLPTTPLKACETNKLWNDLQTILPTIEKIYFCGGEPLLMDEHYVFLEKLHELKKFDVNIWYNTNFSTLSFKNWDAIKLWKNFKNINIFASLDGFSEKAEYIRKGTRWENIIKNREIIREKAPHINF